MSEQPTKIPPQEEEQTQHTEQAPGQKTPERQSDETYAGIASEYINSYAGKIDENDRAQLHSEVVEHIKNIDVQTQDELVAAYGEIIDGLKQYAYARGLTPEVDAQHGVAADTQERPVAESTETAPEGESEDDEAEPKKKYTWRQKARMLLGLPSLAVATFYSRENKFVRQAEESEEEYDARMKKQKWYSVAGGVAIAAVFGAAKAYTAMKGIEHSTGVSLSDHVGDGTGGSAHDSDTTIDGDTNFDGHLDESELAALSHAEESNFIDNNGRQGNDFNDISGEKLRSTMLDENGEVVDNPNVPAGFDALMDQYNASPRELGAQLDQFRDAGIQFPEELSELNRQPGEEYTAYIDRITEAMHGNQELHDNAVQFAADQLIGKEAVSLDGPYRSAYLVEDGQGGYQVYWDERVESPDSNDQIIMLDDKRGIRLPCGQPIELLPQESPVPMGIGGAPAVSVEGYVPSAHTTPYNPEEPGTGGGNPPGEPNEPNEPGEPNEPEEPGEPNDGKQWDKQIDTGMTPLGVTEQTEDFATSGNGTDSPSINGTEQPGSANPNTTAEGAVRGTGETGGTPETDLNQSSQSAIEQATPGTSDATGTADNPNSGRVE